jgi:hypothetical protein
VADVWDLFVVYAAALQAAAFVLVATAFAVAGSCQFAQRAHILFKKKRNISIKQNKQSMGVIMMMW